LQAGPQGRQGDDSADRRDGRRGCHRPLLRRPPEIDGLVYLNGETDLKPGDLVKVRIDEADEYDLWVSLVN
jgi:hypothetical protein